jgi:hypothetical protein
VFPIAFETGTKRIAEQGWTADSKLFFLTDDRAIDVASGSPALVTRQHKVSFKNRLLAGGDPCRWRDAQGRVVLRPPPAVPGTAETAWSSDGSTSFSFVDKPRGQYALVANAKTGRRELVQHSDAAVRREILRDFESNLEGFRQSSSAPPRNANEIRAMLEVSVPQALELGAENLLLSPNGKYLYYNVRSRLSLGNDWNMVVDVESDPPAVWRVPASVAARRWHPNGRDLWFVTEQKPLDPDPRSIAPPAPPLWRIAVARFP